MSICSFNLTTSEQPKLNYYWTLWFNFFLIVFKVSNRAGTKTIAQHPKSLTGGEAQAGRRGWIAVH